MHILRSMYTRLVNQWDAARDSFWFLPAIMSVAALALALMCTSMDGPVESWFVQAAPWVGVSTNAARSSLATIGSAMVSIAGIVFSVMLVTLSITSSQYGSRLLRTFMSDRVTQFTLGLLVGTSLFCMLCLAGIQDSAEGVSTANVSVIVGLVLAVSSLAVLVGFIHHVVSLIQAPHVVAAVAHDLDDSFNRLFPEQLGDEGQAKSCDAFRCPKPGSGSPVHSKQEGYLQAMDADALVSLAISHDLFVHIMVKPGDFIERDQVLLEVWPSEVVASSPVDATAHDFGREFAEKINSTMIAGRRRTPRQDAECALEELVEVAVRALSPGINDPFTAIACLDRLGACLGRLAQRRMPSQVRYDRHGTPRILSRATTFAGLMKSAFDQIRQHGCQSVAVSVHLLHVLTRIAKHVVTDEQRSAIQRQADLLQQNFRQHANEPAGGDEFHERYQRLLESLDAETSVKPAVFG